MSKQVLNSLLSAAILLPVIGCASPPPRTGFICDYESLKRVDDTKARFISPRLSDYNAYMIDPVVIRELKNPPTLTGLERAQVATYFRQSLADVLRKNGYQLEMQAGVGTARIRIAITRITESTWWLNLHPATKLTGAGTGGAAMEGEVIDSVTGEQLAAVVKSGKGSQFEIDTFDKLDDIKDVIDKWASEAEKQLKEFRQARAGGRG